ncbi:RTA1-domain-containing protein [Meira miltonrushii]|uniref:RTA1-domain-containing protein n=1 Tax=Meira miltonrushii TaxID=1280837 RepID=A0A316VG56_9BASI|nr:RTA1-domain-containing protein [Meira miltonrushii]PWN36562.1 RTA1-domain-containing protein [Meira miltonrushii]
MSNIILFARKHHNNADQDQNLSPDVSQALMRISEYGPYGYRPELAGAVVFCVVFGLLAIALTFQGIRGKRWWLLATLAFGSWCECVGNAIRIYGHFHPSAINPYIAQQVILVLTPAFFAAAHFTILTKICQLYGAKYVWPIRPSWMIPAFVLLDVASLAVQGGGSGEAAIAEINGRPVSDINSKGNIVVAGLAIQLAGYLAFNALYILFITRAINAQRKGKAQWFNARQKLFFVAVYVSALFVLGRSAFRTAEMASGWVGKIATTEWYYLVFDATFVAIAVLILTVISPVNYMERVQPSKKQTQSPEVDQTGETAASNSFDHGSPDVEKNA